MPEAIQTRYDGYAFRSRLEARHAVYFNTLNINWRYEPQGFKLASGECYLPDFYLPNVGLRSTEEHGLWVEIKGEYNSDEWDSFAQFCREKDENGAFLTERVSSEWSDETNFQAPRWDNHMMFVMCEGCHHVKYEFSEGQYMNCESCGGHCSENTRPLTIAQANARSARFEHGESPTDTVPLVEREA